MKWSLDARIPVRAQIEGDAVPANAVLLDAVEPAHVLGCACCVVRSPGALAFDRLFLARVKGEVAFASVVVPAAVASSARAVVEDDMVVRARFRWVA